MSAPESRTFFVSHSEKEVAVFCGDIADYDSPLDLLSLSANAHGYFPAEKSIIGAIDRAFGISTHRYTKEPAFDLRDAAGCWLSREIPLTDQNPYIRRIGCIETDRRRTYSTKQAICAIRSYFHLIELAADTGVPVERIAIPFFFTGLVKIQTAFILLPLLQEALRLLDRCDSIRKLVFIERDPEKAQLLTDTLSELLDAQRPAAANAKPAESVSPPRVFISYSSADQQTADTVYDLLRQKNISCWYAAEDIHTGAFSGQITRNIRNCTHFIVLVSQNSMQSGHVLSELCIAFNNQKNGTCILPLLLGHSSVNETELNDSFWYFLAALHWHCIPSPMQPETISRILDKIFSV